jgi:hypothetical protein
VATCPNGHENPEDQRFCGECGAPITEPKPSAADDAVTPEAAATEEGQAPGNGSPVTSAVAWLQRGLADREATARPQVDCRSCDIGLHSAYANGAYRHRRSRPAVPLTPGRSRSRSTHPTGHRGGGPRRRAPCSTQCRPSRPGRSGRRSTRHRGSGGRLAPRRVTALKVAGSPMLGAPIR